MILLPFSITFEDGRTFAGLPIYLAFGARQRKYEQLVN